ncbi:hypothetical protein [Serinibacter salmoneus]|uniref:Uncharacterized protein n=1 Tax=Serinibacter salmoneus TaxID=556530 RepID=A0A2A9CYG5_9MICO|nr:hypothetical protein [Serinibacter salmoneus]PFG19474.1 hypothetical protein ATL40_1038 [Serinibacter salmoneus]
MNVVSLTAVCELTERVGSVTSFRVDQYAVLVSGERVLIPLDFGFDVLAPPGYRRDLISRESLVDSAKVTLVADSEVDELPLDLISFVLAGRGVVADVEVLRGLPVVIELGPRALSLMDAS